MNQETMEEQTISWEDFHPWLARMTAGENEDSIDEVIRYTLDELRFA